MSIPREALQAAIERARAKIAAQKAKAEEARPQLQRVVIDEEETAPISPTNGAAVAHSLRWNPEQAAAIKMGVDKQSFCLIGAAGTGKTTTLKGLLRELIDKNLCAPLEQGTKNLSSGAPGIVLISYTRRAVRNIAKQMPDDLKPHCLTYHKLMEYEPETDTKDIYSDTGEYIETKSIRVFRPQRNRYNPLPRNLTTIVIDEASMLSIDYFDTLVSALPNPRNVQFIVLGDLNQLPPVYGHAILGRMLLDKPVIELTRVYRQALESPIISIALAVKNNDFSVVHSDINVGTFLANGVAHSPHDKHKFSVKDVKEKLVIEKAGRGKVTLHPWKKKWEQDDALSAIMGQFNSWITKGEYIPDEDLILCPWNKSFGTIEMNKSIANKLGKMRNADVYEVIAGYEKYYLAVGDKLMVEKQEAIVLEITRNLKYVGAKPRPHSPYLDRWGNYMKGKEVTDADEDLTNDDVDALLESLSDIEDRTHEASHQIKVRMQDTGEEVTLSKSKELNDMQFGYAISVHKAQGSECRKVFFITHYCHSRMLTRELVYTAITRAAEELYIIMSPEMLATAAMRPRIKGNTLEAKLAWYKQQLEEKLPNDQE